MKTSEELRTEANTIEVIAFMCLYMAIGVALLFTFDPPEKYTAITVLFFSLLYSYLRRKAINLRIRAFEDEWDMK